MQVLQFPSDRENLLIWLPSRYGVRPGNMRFAQSVQQEGIDYWLIDLHASYMALTGRKAYAQFDPQHVKELIDHAVSRGWRNIYIGGESRGAALAMRAARQWQLKNPGKAVLKGLLLFHPHLIDGHTRIGEQAVYHPIARATNLPVYVIQPQYNTKYLHSQDLIAQLETGGAPVFFHPLLGVRGGFHVRSGDPRSQRDAEERELIGQRIKTAITLLTRLPAPLQAAAAGETEPPTRPEAERSVDLLPTNLEEVSPIRLYDERNRLFDLADHRGEVVLVNFWATWCRPCVKEISSLMRLIEHLEGQPFRVVTINIGESKAHVESFFDRLNIAPNFTVLFDLDGEVAKAWKVYAYPSNYLLNKHHKVRYGYRGALKWDEPRVVETIQALFE